MDGHLNREYGKHDLGDFKGTYEYPWIFFSANGTHFLNYPPFAKNIHARVHGSFSIRIQGYDPTEYFRILKPQALFRVSELLKTFRLTDFETFKL